MDPSKSESSEQVKFNMGLATLESIRNLLNYYNKVSILDSFEIDGKNFQITDTLETQIIKSRLCNQLLITARPLLSEDQKTKLEEELKNTNLFYLKIKNSHGDVIKYKKVYSPAVNENCDKFISKLTDLLQENKVFMPGKGEGSLF